ncbi:DUF7524 family protein [Halorubrum laminariae]|uniref:Uncharacterized protein n=1 Tax=Halorubrum laminariae TaxID=1433523 RepID=A0ABD6C3F0_9EURY|nr:hypothetical protein [Halorubrum laminariae]
MPTLVVELNGNSVHEIRAPDRFTASGPFPISFENHGRSTHVHVHFDDDLDRVASVDETNHFVDDEATRHVHVSVSADDLAESVRGKLKIVTGYGSETRYVNVQIDPSTETDGDGVTVDETFTKPPERPPEVPLRQRVANSLDRLVERGSVPAAVLALVAVVAGVAVALAIDSTIVSLAVGVVIAVSVIAALLAVW